MTSESFRVWVPGKICDIEISPPSLTKTLQLPSAVSVPTNRGPIPPLKGTGRVLGISVRQTGFRKGVSSQDCVEKLTEGFCAKCSGFKVQKGLGFRVMRTRAG